MATAVAGYVLGINAFDQPNVQEAKDATKAILASGFGRGPGFDDLGALLKEVTEGDYVAILAYLDRTSETEDAIERVRLAHPRPVQGGDHDRVPARGSRIRRVSSTRAGPTTACSSRWWTPSVRRTCRSRASPTTFGTLIDAQALGDLRSLRARGRRVARGHVRPIDGGALMQLGMVGLGRMGANLTRR